MRKINDRSHRIEKLEDLINLHSAFIVANGIKINRKHHKVNRDHYPEDHKLYGLTPEEFTALIKEAMEKLK